jgi:hypothetical protein
VGRDCWWLVGRPACFAHRFTGNHYREFLLHDLPKLLEDVPLAVRARMWYMHDGAPAHFSCAEWDVLNNTYHGRWIGRGGPTAWPPRSPDLNLRDFYLWGQLKSLVYAAPVDNEDALHHLFWMPVRLSPTIPASLNGGGGPWWDVSRRGLNLKEEVLSTYYKCTLSAITHELNVSGHMLIWTFFLVLVCGIRAQSLSAPFSYTAYRLCTWRSVVMPANTKINQDLLRYFSL